MQGLLLLLRVMLLCERELLTRCRCAQGRNPIATNGNVVNISVSANCAVIV
jgi:hypothetical protein